MNCVIATSGTGGHLFPAIKVADQLQARGHQVLFLGSFRRGTQALHERHIKYIDLNVIGLNRKDPVTLIRFAAKTIAATWRSTKLLREFSAHVVIGFGGYGSAPVVLAGAIKRVPVLLHEQNVMPGRANKFLSRFADQVLTSFEKTKEFFPGAKAVHVGYPVWLKMPRETKADLIRSWGLSPDKKILLIFGGSQGSRAINREFMKAVRLLKERESFQVIHLCGDADMDALKKEYAALGIGHVVLNFSHEMERAYAVADGVIARAGAGTVFEIAHFKLPSVLIPYPFAGGHQKDNARVLESLGAAAVIEEAELDATRLYQAIEEKIFRSQKVALGSLDQLCRQDAAERIADLAEQKGKACSF